jgi:hypothetical protein
MMKQNIDYKQLERLVREAMFSDVGGGDEGSAPEGVPHRMPAGDTQAGEENQGDEKANDLYAMALEARESTERLVEALDEPIYDQAYEYAFKASANMRKALISLEQSGAHPMPDQRVVAGPEGEQRFGNYVPYGKHGAGYGGNNGRIGTGLAGIAESSVEIDNVDPKVQQLLASYQNLSEDSKIVFQAAIRGETGAL